MGSERELVLTSRRLRAPRAGAIAGIVFSILMLTSLVVTRISVPANPVASGRWLVTESGSVEFALNLLPFAGLAFLWFIGVLRDRLGDAEDRFFATVCLGSGLLFIALLFVAAGIATGITRIYRLMPDQLMESGLYLYARTVTYQIVNVYAIKMAAAFMFSTSTISIHTGIFPRWIAFLGFGVAVSLLVASAYFFWAPVLFPLWVLLVSISILSANLRTERAPEVRPA